MDKSKGEGSKGKANLERRSSSESTAASIHVSYDDSHSSHSSKSSTLSRIRHGGHYASEIAKKKNKDKEAHPERRLLFRPKVHDFWRKTDIDDEIADRERLIHEISMHELQIKKKKADANDLDSDGDSSDDDSLNRQKAALERLKSRRHREQVYKERTEAEMAREDKEKAQEYEDKLQSELQNPSKYGWFYGDGYYENAPFFGVKEQYIERMVDEQEVWKEKWINNHPETFTQKFKRFFWPPKLRFKNRMFRTRGTYMDFPEVIADWPKPIDINFEKTNREFISNSDDIFKEEDVDIVVLDEEIVEDDSPIVKKAPVDDSTRQKVHVNQGRDYNWDDWYYDDALGEFFRKKDGFMVDYYMDSKNKCWRLKRPQTKPGRQPTPYDWYFDASTGNIVPRDDYRGIDEFVFDNWSGIYRIQSIVPTAVKKGRKSKTKAAKALKETEKKNQNRIYSYYFDEEKGMWLLKEDAPEEKRDQILWDENGFRFARKVEGDWRGLTSFSPDDYYFNDKKGRFNPKPPRQGKDFRYHEKDGVWRKSSAKAPDPSARITGSRPADYYFDELEGQFKLKDVDAQGKYWLQKFAKIWRKNPAPKSGMNPEEFYWDRDKKHWLPRVIRMEMLHNAQSVRNQWTSEITRGARNTELTQPEAFFWDVEEGKFILKKKKGSYYLDTDGFWKSTKLRDKQRNRLHPYDFFYDPKVKDFAKKLKGESYVFNNVANVWTTANAPDQFQCEFYFDVQLEKWVQSGSSTEELVDVGILVKPHPDERIKIPGDFWFHEAEGRFYPKTLDDAKEYFYNHNEGAWKKRGISGPNTNGLHPRNFFFDDHDNRFKLKVDGQKKDYWYDNNNKIFRHVVASGETRSGYLPTDFYWNSDLKSYVLEKPGGKLRGKIVSDLPEWDPMRRYDKGWLPSEDQSLQSVSAPQAKKL